MKKFHFLFILFGIFFCSMNVNAQLLEAKINPLGALFNSPDVSIEYIINDDIGVEAKIGYNWNNDGTIISDDTRINGFTCAVIGKYYFNPENGCDRFYSGLYGKFKLRNGENHQTLLYLLPDYRSTAVALGLVLGFKLVGQNNIVLDINAGLGRPFVNNVNFLDGTVDSVLENEARFGGIDGISTIALGYRFGGK